MKTNNTLLIFLVLLVQISFGQTIATKEIQGKILEQSTAIEGVNVINNNTQQTVISDANGMFLMVVREGDVLVFSAVNLESLKRRITPEILNSATIQVKMVAKQIELKEVIVNENAEINAESLGIIPKGQKKYTPAERRLRSASSTPIDALLNTISGRKEMLKKELAVEKKEILFGKIKYLFEDTYYTSRLKIPSKDIEGFQRYCINDAEFALSLDTKNRAMSMFLMTNLAQQYLKIIENEN